MLAKLHAFGHRLRFPLSIIAGIIAILVLALILPSTTPERVATPQTVPTVATAPATQLAAPQQPDLIERAQTLQTQAQTWAPKTWLAVAITLLGLVLLAHVMLPHRGLAFAVAAWCVAGMLFLFPPITPSPTGESWETALAGVITATHTLIGSLTPQHQMVVWGVMAVMAALFFVYLSYQTKDYALVSVGLFVLGVAIPLTLVAWNIIGSGGNLFAFGTAPEVPAAATTLEPVPYHYGVVRGGPIGKDGYRVLLWHKGHCVRAEDSKGTVGTYCDLDGKRADGKAPMNPLPPDVRYAWSADDAFDGGYALVR